MSRARSVDEHIVWRAARRFGLQTAATVAVAFVGLAAVLVLVYLHSQHQAEDALLERSIARDDMSDPSTDVWLVLRRGGRDTATPGLPAGLPDNGEFDEVFAHRATTTADLTTHQHAYRVVTEPLPGGSAIQAVLDLRADRAQRQSLLAAFLIAGLTGLLGAAGVGLLLARWAVQPLAAALALQRRFVADASHELRTPLTLLTTRAQLIRRTLRTGAHTGAESVRSDAERLVGTPVTSRRSWRTCCSPPIPDRSRTPRRCRCPPWWPTRWSPRGHRLRSATSSCPGRPLASRGL